MEFRPTEVVTPQDRPELFQRPLEQYPPTGGRHYFTKAL